VGHSQRRHNTGPNQLIDVGAQISKGRPELGSSDSCARPAAVLCGNPNVLQAQQIRSITAATNPRMPVGLLNREAITVERASALASENVRLRQYPFEFVGGSAVQSG
jgi:hypothetical protein